jgi:hypothetical protein
VTPADDTAKSQFFNISLTCFPANAPGVAEVIVSNAVFSMSNLVQTRLTGYTQSLISTSQLLLHIVNLPLTNASITTHTSTHAPPISVSRRMVIFKFIIIYPTIAESNHTIYHYLSGSCFFIPSISKSSRDQLRSWLQYLQSPHPLVVGWSYGCPVVVLLSGCTRCSYVALVVN